MGEALLGDDKARSLGERLRVRRGELNLTLRDVADGAGLSTGFISQVERGLAAPSLSSLAGICAVLDTPIGHFLDQPRNTSPLTRHGERPVYRVGDGPLRYERLSSSFAGSLLNSVIFHEPPGHRSEPIRHPGEELFFVLAGALTVEVEGRRSVLETGASIHFASTREHSTWNHTGAPATILHVCTYDLFGDAPDGAAARPKTDINSGDTT